MDDARNYREGDRVKLVRMHDEYRSDIPIGVIGTVVGIAPPPVNCLNVAWDNGFGLNPCLDADAVSKVGSVRNGREFYTVMTDDDGRKVVKYQGYTWHRPDADGEKTCACTTIGGCYVDIANIGPEEDVKETIGFIAECCQQYQEDITELEFYGANLGFFGGTAGVELDVAEVGDDTPDGNYYYEVDGQ